MREFGDRLVPLGELVDVRFGVNSGCDAFLVAHDITREALAFEGSEHDVRRALRWSRGEVHSGD
jgi:hypothetical protein